MFLVICRKCVREIQVKQNLTRITRRPVLPKDLCTFVILSRYILLIMRNILGKSYRENENTFYVQCLFFPKNVPFTRKWCSQGGHRRQFNTAHAHFMLVNKGYRHTFRICNNYCFSTATVVMQTRQIVTLYVCCLTCFFKHPY